MANLSTKTQVRFVPNLPGNKALPVDEQLTFLITAGFSTMELRAWGEKMKNLNTASAKNGPSAAKLLDKAFDGFISIGAGTHTIDRKPIRTVGEYLILVGQQPGSPFMSELVTAVMHHNSVEGLRELFSVRSFGGTLGTAKAGTETKPAAAH